MSISIVIFYWISSANPTKKMLWLYSYFFSLWRCSFPLFTLVSLM